MFICIFLSFCYIFVFPIGNIPLIDSSFLTFVILFLKLILNKKYCNYVKKLLYNKKIVYIIGLIWGLCLFSAFITSMHGVYDFTIIVTFIHQAIAVLIGIMLYAYLQLKGKKVLDIVIYTFWIQSCIQVVSMMIPEFYNITNIFRLDSAILKGQNEYGGFRGTAISGSAFFGLSVAYGLIFIIWGLERRSVLNNVSKIKKSIIVFLMIIGGISAGRTFIIGLAITCIVIVIDMVKDKKVDIKMFVMFFSVCLLGIYVIDYLIEYVSAIRYFINYANELVRNYFSGNGFTSSSTSKLFGNMYFPIDIKTFLIGTGRYSNANGTYYMFTDAGYMRNLLFFGIFGFIFFCILQMQYFYVNGMHGKFQRAVCFVYLIITHVKGETIGFLISVESILILYMYFQINTISIKRCLRKK